MPGKTHVGRTEGRFGWHPAVICSGQTESSKTKSLQSQFLNVLASVICIFVTQSTNVQPEKVLK